MTWFSCHWLIRRTISAVWDLHICARQLQCTERTPGSAVHTQGSPTPSSRGAWVFLRGIPVTVGEGFVPARWQMGDIWTVCVACTWLAGKKSGPAAFWVGRTQLHFPPPLT